MTHTRRSVLTLAAAFGVTVNFAARAAFAAADGQAANRKLVAVVLRGGLDGLSLSPPVGDPDYAALRGPIAIPAGQALKLDSTFALHPALVSVHRLALAGQARIAPAIASPDRARSHFEAQDVLETGGGAVYSTSSGWLNRALSALGPRKIEAMSIGATTPLILRGAAPAGSWSPGAGADPSARFPTLLSELYVDDHLLGPALARGLETESMAKVAQELEGGDAMTSAAAQAGARLEASGQGAPAARQLGQTVARFMTQPGGPQVVAISIDGFDTHANQGAATGQLATRLSYLDAVLDGLASGLGPEWKNTVIVAATEFGRTAHVNGTSGTDHGTASTALVLGGGLKPGGIIGDWPTLKSAALFENRDTRPTLDMRGLFKGVLADHLGVDGKALDTTVFPGSQAVEPVAGMV
ncbi:MAG: hypothetical protein JWM33_2962 [Caulobacteraceae bacterium]|nr:hypothetical protein [Caulobacteraceae bacterium]